MDIAILGKVEFLYEFYIILSVDATHGFSLGGYTFSHFAAHTHTLTYIVNVLGLRYIYDGYTNSYLTHSCDHLYRAYTEIALKLKMSI